MAQYDAQPLSRTQPRKHPVNVYRQGWVRGGRLEVIQSRFGFLVPGYLTSPALGLQPEIDGEAAQPAAKGGWHP